MSTDQPSSDPNLRWDGSRWIRWNGSTWVDATTGYPVTATPVGLPPAKKSGNGCLIAVIVGVVVVAVLVVIIIIAAVAGGGSNGSAPKNDTCVGKTYPDKQPTDVCADAANTVVTRDMTVIATPLKSEKSSLGSGTELCSTVTVKNTSNESQDYNTFNFKLQSPSGAVETTSGLGFNSDFGSGAIVAGGSKTGKVCTSVKAVEKGQWVFIYDPSPFTDERGIWLTTL